MRGYAMLKIGESGWIEKERPVCGPLDAICRPIAVAICSSDVHTLWAGAIGERHNMILGHECCAEVVEVGSLVKDFKPGDRVLVPAITPDWSSEAAQAGWQQHSGGMLGGWKFSNYKDGVFADFFHVNDADGNLAHLPEGMDRWMPALCPTWFPPASMRWNWRMSSSEIRCWSSASVLWADVRPGLCPTGSQPDHCRGDPAGVPSGGQGIRSR